MYQITLSDIMKDIGVRKHPDYFSGIKVKHKPMPHQLEMMKLYTISTRYGDFGEPGSGKTYPAHIHGILMASLGNKVVYTMPPKLIDQFEEEMHDYFIGIGHYLKMGKLNVPAAKKRQLVEQWDKEGWPDILFMSYDGYREFNDVNKAKKIGANQWYYQDGTRYDEEKGGQAYTKNGRIISKRGTAENDKHLLLNKKGYNVFFFDEAHALCGLNSIISQSVDETAKGNTAIYLMTGTPVPTVISDAYGIIRLINPDAYSSRSSFERQHIVYRQQQITVKGRVRMIRIPSSFVNVEKIHQALYQNARRIQKRDIIKMPDPLITDVKVKLTGAHSKLYKDIMRDHFALVGDTILSPENQQQARHMSLQIISCPTQFDSSISMENELFDRTKDLVETIDPSKNKIVVFAYYRTAIEFLKEKFSDLEPAVLYGGTTNATEEVNRFKKDDNCRMIILNWMSGGAGLNLQVASHIIFYECPTSPKDATQAVARCDRTGQQNIVNVYFMRVLGTLSDKNFRKLLEAEEDVNKVVQDDLDLLHKQLRK